MSPERELNALIAEKVFGWSGPAEVLGLHLYMDDPEGNSGEVPEYSTDIAAAWEVVERVSAGLNKFAREFWIQRENVGKFPEFEWSYSACFQKDHSDHSCAYHATAETAPHAICLAALKTLEAE